MSFYFTKDHEWARVEEGRAVIGISRHAADELGDITFVDLPKEGKEVRQSDAIASIESVKAASDIYSPVSGKVIRVNEALEKMPELINENPEEAGWLVRIEMTDPDELQKLMTQAEYAEYLKKS